MKKRSHFCPFILAKIEIINLNAGISTVKKACSYNTNGNITNDKLSGNQLRKMHQKFSQCSPLDNSISKNMKYRNNPNADTYLCTKIFTIGRIIRQVVVYIAYKELLMTCKRIYDVILYSRLCLPKYSQLPE